MGSHDYINGVETLVFYHPVFDVYLKNTINIGGFTTSYYTGNQVPIKTLYYNRPKDFLVFDENEYQNNPLLHVIKDGIVFDTISLKDATDDLFGGNILVLNRYGDELNIKSKENCYSFIKDSIKYNQNLKKIKEPLNTLLETKFTPTDTLITFIKFHAIENREMLDIIFKSINERPIVLKTLQKKLSFESLEEHISSFSDEDLYNYFTKTIFPLIKEKNNQYIEEINRLDTKIKPLLDKIEKEYRSKYFKESSYKVEAQLGEYLYCLIDMYPHKDQEEIPRQKPNREIYDTLIDILKDFINKHNNIVDSYIKWLELDDMQAQYIKSICEGIFINPNDLLIEHI